MEDLSNLRVAVLATDGFEQLELTEPVKALRAAGARVEVIAPKAGEIQGFRHLEPGVRVRVDRVLDEVQPAQYDALVLPGGALNADALRGDERVQTLLKEMQNAGRPIASICHAPWILISSGLVSGRTLTSFSSIQDDIRNAGGTWVDREAVVDKNWVTSRKPEDLPAFIRETIALFSRSSPSVIQIAVSA